MKRIVHFFVTLIVVVAALLTASPQTPGSSPGNPASVGTALADIIECGEGYTSHELYDMKVTLLEVIRGEEAWKRIREASAANKPPEPGTEYVLARIRCEYFARGVPGLCVHPLAPDQFKAYSASGEDYRAASVVPPKPELRKGLKSGESVEGWVAFAVSEKDQAPLMSFSVDDGGAVEHGGGKWFLLKSGKQ